MLATDCDDQSEEGMYFISPLSLLLLREGFELGIAKVASPRQIASFAIPI